MPLNVTHTKNASQCDTHNEGTLATPRTQGKGLCVCVEGGAGVRACGHSSVCVRASAREKEQQRERERERSRAGEKESAGEF